MSPLVISSAFFALTVVSIVSVYAALYGDWRAFEQQVEGMAVRQRAALGAIASGEFAHFGRMIVRFVETTMPRGKSRAAKASKGSIAQTLAQAGYRHKQATSFYRLVQAGSAILVGAIAFLVLTTMKEGTAIAAMCAAAMGYFGLVIPTVIVRRKARIRVTAITHELSDVLDLMIVCVEAGLGVNETIALVGRETARHGKQIGTELMLVSREIGSGASFGEALRGMADRLGIEELKPIAATMIQSEQLGGQIAPALRSNSDTLRGKRRLKAEAAAQKATVKILFPLVLFVLPAMLLVIVGPAIIHIVRTIRA